MKNTLTKVLTIVAVILVLLIAISATTLSIVKSDFNQVIDTNKIEGVTVYLPEGRSNYYSNEHGKNVFDKILELYNKGTKETILSSLFQGAYSNQAKAEVISNTVSTTTLENPSKGTIYLKIYFKDEQKLIVNGKVVEDNSIYGDDKSIKFNTAYFTVENNSTLTKVTCYIVSGSSRNNSYRQVKFVTHHSELFEYLNSLDFPG